MLNLILLATIVFKGRPVQAAAKKVYKTEIVPTDQARIQDTLDQRATEGWQLVSASGLAGSGRDAVVLIFEK
jgi:hypothetical protein